MRIYSDIVMDHFFAPRNGGKMDSPDHIGLVGVPGQGPYMVLCLRVCDGRVTEAKFQTYGCGPAIAAGSLLTEMITGRPIPECLAITREQLTDALGGVPYDKLHCPAFAVEALRNALRDYAAQDPALGP